MIIIMIVMVLAIFIIIYLLASSRVDGKCIVEGEKWGGMMKVGKGADTERDRFTHDMVNIGPGLPLRVFFFFIF